MSIHIRVSPEFYEFIKTFASKINKNIPEASRILANCLTLVDNVLDVKNYDAKILIVVINDRKQLIYATYSNEDNIFNF